MRERFLTFWTGLTERERRLVSLLGAVAALVTIFLVVYLPSQAIAAIEEDNEEIVEVLADIGAAHTRLEARAHERAVAEARFDVRAPALASFLEATAGRESVALTEVTNQPEVEEGRFRRRHVRAEIGNASLRTTIRFLSALESEPYPIALERIHLEHFGAGSDRFNVEVGVITFDRTGAGSPDAGVPEAAPAEETDRPGRAGPPAP
jgi:hypothetical protein